MIYQYNLVEAKNHYMGLIQTESVCEFFRYIAFVLMCAFSVIVALLPAYTSCADPLQSEPDL